MNRKMTPPAVIIALLLVVLCLPVAGASAATTVVTPVVTAPTGTAGSYVVGSTLKASWTTSTAPASGEFVVMAGTI